MIGRSLGFRHSRRTFNVWKYALNEESPIRTQLFSPEKLVEEAKLLAQSQVVDVHRPPDPLVLYEFRKNSKFLHEAYNSVNEALKRGEPIPPAEEWFVDNFHVISEQLKGIEEDLPKKFYMELPSLVEGPLKGCPRTYEIALHLIAHTDSRLDPVILKDFIHSYQSISILTTGELWALAILLRVGLIENLKRLILVSDKERDARRDADRFADALLQAQSEEEIQEILKERDLDPRAIRGAFAVQLMHRLQEAPRVDPLAVEWLYKKISQTSMNPDEMIRRKHQDLAAAQISVSNVILSLRLLATMDWPELVEEVSSVDAQLRKDPSGHYSQCDFATRDRYRHIVEQLSKRSDLSETETAAATVRLALRLAEGKSAHARTAHVGYYLIDEGRSELERFIAFKPDWRTHAKRILTSAPGYFYSLPIALLTLTFLTLLLHYARAHQAGASLLFLVGFVGLIPSSAVAILIVNWGVTLLIRPKVLPKLELKEGVPPNSSSFVVLPILLTTSEEIHELISRLEVHYLANNDDALDFALLSDYQDADTETTPLDKRLLQEARRGIAALNAKYPRSGGPRFHIFHRRRLWNPLEGKWMGRERKRGKLEEFNRLLLGDRNTSYLPVEVPDGIRFVITLDADTALPRDSARKLIGTLSHPLNLPVMDPVDRHIKEGYGILQPRVSHTLSSANRTGFAKIFSGASGIDPYTTAVSDIYQDLFQEASYVGKGIYDLQAFHMAVSERFPENRLLSHDLIEGSYARTGLITDVEIFDDFPSDYTSYITRLHRWVRGDWQLLPWLLPRVPDAHGDWIRNTLSWLSSWKLLDNLRRSLVSPTLFLTLLFGWTIFPGSSAFWSLFVVGVIFAPPVLSILTGILRPVSNVPWLTKVWATVYETGLNVFQCLIQISFLVNEAYVMFDAICRTLYRMVRHRKMLEWVTAAQAETRRVRDLLNYIQRMYGSHLLTFASFIILILTGQTANSAAIGYLTLWVSAPIFAYLSGLEIPARKRKLPEHAIPKLHSHARDTWRYFETFVGDESHWLPPDNFQEIPHEMVAHRTSPTNIGFLLLSNIVAYDFGYIGATEFVERTERTMNTLTRLKTFNGHLFNWYDTKTLNPLEPRYVSTVDSGNLVAALVILSQFALRFGLIISKSFEPQPRRFDGVRDTFNNLIPHVQKFPELRSKISQHFQRIRDLLQKKPADTVEQETLLNQLKQELEAIGPPPVQDAELQFWWKASQRVVVTHLMDYARPQDLSRRLLAIAREADAFSQEIDFRFLYNEERGVFSIGFNVTNGQLDGSSYDLFASEARLSSFVAISKGDVPQLHWFRMARHLVSIGRRRVAVSWSGSMFEYLMPLLCMRNEPNTLLDEAYRGAVLIHRLYGKSKKVPWGISEAAYNIQDHAGNYQYGPFGVPKLALKRGLESKLVIAPYATFLAALVDPATAIKNLEHLERYEMRGRFGFYESLDFTPQHLPKGEKFAIVRAFMAHHQGMSLVALDDLLHDDVMQKRFHAEPAVQATELLLQEKMPLATRSAAFHVVNERMELPRTPEPVVAREFRSPFITPPRTQILSYGNYQVVLTTGGSGYSECRKLRITRWREDVTRDPWGSFVYLKDLKSGRVWSAGFHPVCRVPDVYNVMFHEDRVEFRRRDGTIETQLDVVVSTEDDAEIRRITLVNTSSDPVEIELTSYLEVVLNSAAADLAHPAFSNLFVGTEFVPMTQCLLAYRRPQAFGDPVPWAGHVVMSENPPFENVEFETDRSRFIGRTRNLTSPQALQAGAILSGTTGEVLDPIFSLRRRVQIEPYSRAVIAFTTILANSRGEAVSVCEKYSTSRGVTRAFDLAYTHAQVMLKQLGLTVEEAHLFQRIAGRLIYSDLSLRPSQVVLASNVLTQAGLWPHGISGDLPICLVRIEDVTELDILRQLLHAHEYWRLKGFVVDLVVLNEHPSSYFQDLQDEIMALIRSTPSHMLLDKPGGIFVRRADQMAEEERILLRVVARVQIVAQRGSLARQVARVDRRDPLPPLHIPLSTFPMREEPLPIHPPATQFENGYGGFTEDGREFVIHMNEGVHTPAPWINVIANPKFGFQISETGSGMTWSANSRENRLTPWSNDPVQDPIGFAVYVRDEESGEFWSPTLLPSTGKGAYLAAHGIGYSRFHYGGSGIEQVMKVYVPPDQPVKILKLHFRNQTRRSRWLSVTYYADLVLGTTKSHAAPFVITSIDQETGAVFARNPYNNEFAGRITFVAMNDRKRTVTTDRTMFLGPNGDPSNPAAMSYAHATGRVGAGLDPCVAIQGQIRLNPLSEHTAIFLLGETEDEPSARRVVKRYLSATESDVALEESSRYWDQILGKIQVKTPDAAMNLLLNRWLLYQTLGCRFWARSGFYQSSGAYGFRDQLQDALALVFSKPELLRDHLLLAASRQFLEGDVQHWWHPPSGRGVRTRSSDDLLWLPYCTGYYVHATGDFNILREQIPYLEAPELQPEEMEAYIVPQVSKVIGTLYEHCYKAIERSLKFGPHDLPLIGSGDWNDGMNRLGIGGKGESVWLGWFLIRILKDFAALCEKENDADRAARYRAFAKKIAAAIDANAWDGAWYRRAYDDEGNPIGSSQSDECKIDLIAQTWAVLSGGGEARRIKQAMKSVEEHLLLPEEGMALLLTPPFQHTKLDPGYIKAYPPGIRENGGQYTHAAIWLIAAYAELGEGDKAGQLFQRINPIAHSLNREKSDKYKVEPYVVVADIYSHPSHLGRGGWTWYTGSASWLYRVGIEWILGFRLHGDCFSIDPCIPRNWEKFELTFQHHRAKYLIQVENPNKQMHGVQRIRLNGVELKRRTVPLDKTAGEHTVIVTM